MSLTTDLTCNLGHEFPRSNLRIAIYSKYLTSSSNMKKSEYFEWVNNLFVDNIWSTFSFHHMLQCRPDVTFLSMETLVWPYHYATAIVCVCVIIHAWVLFLGFTSYTHRSYMKFTQLHVTRTQKMCKLSFMIYYICLKIIETQTGWQSNSVRRNHAIWPGVKMERTGRIQYQKIQQWIKLKITPNFGTDYIVQPTHVVTRSKVTSDSIVESWYTVWDKTGDMHCLWMENLPKINYSLRCVQWIG